MCTCFELRRLNRGVTALYDRHLQAAGLRATQYALLSWLERRGPLPMAELAQHMGMDRTTLTRNARAPLAQGWIVKHGARAGCGDPRAVWLALTPAGIERHRAARRLWRRAQQQMHAMLGDEGLDALHRLIRTTLDRLPVEA